MSKKQMKGSMPNFPGGNNNAPQMNFSREAIESATDMKCSNVIKFNDSDETRVCNGELFVEAARLKYISPIMSPTGQQTVATVNIGKMCVACGKIFNPDEWLKKHQQEEKAIKGTILDSKGK
jgi:hypothetical protein